MKIIQKISLAYKNRGLLEVVKKIFRYFTNWRVRREDIIWFMTRFSLIQQRPATKVHGLTYYIRPDDPGISRELAVYHVHEPNATKLFADHLKKGMYEVDIGSNLGYYALLATTLVGPKGKVLAIEPEPQNCELLAANAKKNHINNMDIIQCAISNKNGESEFYVTEASNTSSLISPATGRVISSVKVKVKKLDTLLKEFGYPHVHFIRMDIEGGEILAIEGMNEILGEYKPIILIELHCDAVGVDSIMKFLKKLEIYGYNAKCIVDRDQDFLWKRNKCVLNVTSMNQLFELIPGYRVATVLLK